MLSTHWQQPQGELTVFVRKFLTAEALLVLRQGSRSLGTPCSCHVLSGVKGELILGTLPCMGHQSALCS